MNSVVERLLHIRKEAQRADPKFSAVSGGRGRSYNYDGRAFTKGTPVLVGMKLPLERGEIQREPKPRESYYTYAQG